MSVNSSAQVDKVLTIHISEVIPRGLNNQRKYCRKFLKMAMKNLRYNNTITRFCPVVHPSTVNLLAAFLLNIVGKNWFIILSAAVFHWNWVKTLCFSVSFHIMQLSDCTVWFSKNVFNTRLSINSFLWVE